MKNTESIGWLCDWFTFSARLRSRDETKIKNQSKQNKYADSGYRRTMYNCMGHTWQ
jgi:hypothetical protein